MARFKIESTWDQEVDGEPVVELEYDRLEDAGDDAAAGQQWRVLGTQRLTDLPLMTPKRVRAAAVAWLTEHAGMRPDDSFELYSWIRADRAALEQIEAAVGT